MKIHNLLTIIFLTSLFYSCQPPVEPKDFKLITADGQKYYALGKSFELKIDNPKGHEIDSVAYFRNGERIPSGKITIENEKLGRKTFSAKIYVGDQSFNVNNSIGILSKFEPKRIKYKIINEYPHDINAYTQGFEFNGDTLYEGTGKRGISQLRKLDYKSGMVLHSINLEPQHFGEGITIMGDKIYQLTWQAKKGFVYNINDFSKVKDFDFIRSKEGWGLCNDGNVLYKSDGTEKIWRLDPETLEEKDFIQIYSNDGPISQVNELEYINGKIFANIYMKNGIAIINPETGAVEGVINGTDLHKKVKTKHPEEVLNGIAYNKVTNTIFVTGKNWDKVFEIELID
ncbi:MAG: glutaminyl-peptide cyclotransferase [Flavobacteriaceae bacterium]|nr:glutaminyl-peptide cyclotransferase [Flavobacteriaceae bacterium]